MHLGLTALSKQTSQRINITEINQVIKATSTVTCLYYLIKTTYISFLYLYTCAGRPYYSFHPSTETLLGLWRYAFQTSLILEGASVTTQKNVSVGGEEYYCFMLVHNMFNSFLERREELLAVFLKAMSLCF